MSNYCEYENLTNDKKTYLDDVLTPMAKNKISEFEVLYRKKFSLDLQLMHSFSDALYDLRNEIRDINVDNAGLGSAFFIKSISEEHDSIMIELNSKIKKLSILTKETRDDIKERDLFLKNIKCLPFTVAEFYFKICVLGGIVYYFIKFIKFCIQN